MAKNGGSDGRGRRPQPRPGRSRASGHDDGRAARAAAHDRAGRPGTTPARDDEPPRTFRLGAVAGTTPGTWIARWRERMPRVPLELVPLDAAQARRALDAGEADAALVRSRFLTPPLGNRDGLHLIGLYDDVTVVMMSTDSALTAVDELEPADLTGEVVIRPGDDVLGLGDLPGTIAPSFPAPAATDDAIATVAAGVGVVIVPMSLARMHHRRDVTYRPLRGAPVSPVALAWVADRTTADIETFVGIARGRTANSSR